MLILPPFHVGDTATLHAPSELVCNVTDPAGVSRTLITDGTRTDIHLEMVGTYVYAWSDGTMGELYVVEAVRPMVAP